MAILPEDRAAFSESLRRRRGRPRAASPMVVVNVRVSQELYDSLCRRAARERAPLPEVVRRVLRDAAGRRAFTPTPEFT